MFPGAPLVSFTVILPGAVKRDARSLRIAREGVRAIEASLQDAILYREERDLPTGYEAFFVTDMPSLDLKSLCCKIEDNHQLGRLMDIDVIADGRPLGRADAGLPERRCLMCHKPARECMRLRTHTPAELDAAIAAILVK